MTSPDLSVVRGQPTEEEVAALVLAVSPLTDAASAPQPAPQPARSPWASYAHTLRRTPRPGPEAWRASGLP